MTTRLLLIAALMVLVAAESPLVVFALAATIGVALHDALALRRGN